MFANRMFYVLIVLALVAAIFFTYEQAASAGAIARAGQSNAQALQLEEAILRSHRGGMKPDLSLNGQSATTYRGGFDPTLVLNMQAITSYDAIEELRAQRSVP